jgi:tight adherence protein C
VAAVRLMVASGLVLWVGATLLLSQLRWFSRPPLVERLRPYSPGGMAAPDRGGVLSVESFREVIGPVSRRVGEQVARLFGVSEELAVRLERVHSPLDVTAFRVRQVGWSVAAVGVAALVSAAVRPAPAVAVLLLLGAPLLAFLILEQQMAAASERWQRRLFLELPVVSEQLAMLLSAGFSLGSALNRLAARGDGACAADLRRVTGRIRQGLSEIDALREWADVARVGALDRLVPVLALNREAGDLGRLISDEARNIRRDVQRELMATMERRGQQVWVPVTVATLVPGVIFLSIPFLEALSLFSGT